MPQFIEIAPNGNIISRVLLNPYAPIDIEDEMGESQVDFDIGSSINILEEQSKSDGVFDNYFRELFLQEVQPTHDINYHNGIHENPIDIANTFTTTTTTTSKYSNNENCRKSNPCGYSFNNSASKLYSRLLLDINRGSINSKLFDLDANMDLMILHTPNVLKFTRHVYTKSNTKNCTQNNLCNDIRSTEINYMGTLLCSSILSISPESFLECLASSIVPGVYGSVFIIAYRNSIYTIDDNDCSSSSNTSSNNLSIIHEYPHGTMLDLSPGEFSDGIAYFSKKGYRKCGVSKIYKQLNQLLIGNPDLVSIISTVSFTEHDTILVDTKPLQCNIFPSSTGGNNTRKKKPIRKTKKPTKNNTPQKGSLKLKIQQKKTPTTINTIPNSILDRFLVSICNDLGSFITQNYQIIKHFVIQVKHLFKQQNIIQIQDDRIDIEKEFARYMYCCLISSNAYRNTLLNSLDSFDGSEYFINPRKSLMMFLNISVLDSSLSSQLSLPNFTFTNESDNPEFSKSDRSNGDNCSVDNVIPSAPDESSINLAIVLDYLKQLCRTLGISLYDFYVPGKGILAQYKTDTSFILLVETLSKFDPITFGGSLMTESANQQPFDSSKNTDDHSSNYNKLANSSLLPLLELINM